MKSKSTIIIMAIFIGSVYQVVKFLKNKENAELHKPIEINTTEERKNRNTKSFVKSDEDKNQFIMKDKRINPIAPTPRPTQAQRIERPVDVRTSTGSPIPQSNLTNPTRNKIPQNLERILQYELNTWSRGLDSEEIGYLKHLWGKYTSNGTFGSEEEAMVEKLEKRNILNAIRASKPTIIKSKEDIEKEESRQREKEYADLEKSYDEEPQYNDSYNDSYDNYQENVDYERKEASFDRVERDINRSNRGNFVKDDSEDFYEEPRTFEMRQESGAYDNYDQEGYNPDNYSVDSDGGDEVVDYPDYEQENPSSRDYYDDSY